MEEFDSDVPQKSTQFCRKMARKTLERFSAETTLPVPVFKIAKSQGFDIEKIEMDKNISAKLYPELETISVNSKHPRVRQRFSVAHELGHQLLGHPDEQSYFGDIELIKLYDSEADEFAGELLVPLDLLKKECEACTDIDELRKRFEVSEQVLVIQIKKHGLLGKFTD